MLEKRENFQDYQRIVVKVGSSSLTCHKTGHLDLNKMEILVRQLSAMRASGKDVILVSSGAIMVGAQLLQLPRKPHVLSRKQACASVGQAKLMMLYQKLFSEYSQICSQILLTKHTMNHTAHRRNAANTFEELLDLGIIPIVNENDTIATDEIEFGDNDTLSALVAALVKADLLILLSDIDGLYSDDPNKNKDAKFIEEVYEVDDTLFEMAKGVSSNVGTGGMTTKIRAACIAGDAGADMIIANGEDFRILSQIVDGDKIGTIFHSKKDPGFQLETYLDDSVWVKRSRNCR
jgi:glutamate 5-kinase